MHRNLVTARALPATVVIAPKKHWEYIYNTLYSINVTYVGNFYIKCRLCHRYVGLKVVSIVYYNNPMILKSCKNMSNIFIPQINYIHIRSALYRPKICYLLHLTNRTQKRLSSDTKITIVSRLAVGHGCPPNRVFLTHRLRALNRKALRTMFDIDL